MRIDLRLSRHRCPECGCGEWSVTSWDTSSSACCVIPTCFYIMRRPVFASQLRLRSQTRFTLQTGNDQVSGTSSQTPADSAPSLHPRLQRRPTSTRKHRSGTSRTMGGLPHFGPSCALPPYERADHSRVWWTWTRARTRAWAWRCRGKGGEGGTQDCCSLGAIIRSRGLVQFRMNGVASRMIRK